MKYMLDTNICIYAIKKKPPAVIRRILATNPEQLCISSITYAELMYGAEKSQWKERSRTALALMMASITILNFDGKAAEMYGMIRAELEARGTPIGSMDMLIAAHAMAEELTVVTNNIREFSRIEELRVEDWTQE